MEKSEIERQQHSKDEKQQVAISEKYRIEYEK